MRLSKKAGVSLLLSAGLVATPALVAAQLSTQAAYAEEGTASLAAAGPSIKIQVSESASIARQYNGYKIFSGDVNDEGTSMSNLQWASPEIETAVKAVLTDKGFTYSTVQAAAEYIKTNIGVSDNTAVLAKDTLGIAIAKALQSKTVAVTVPVNAATNLPSAGYYVFTPKDFSTTTESTMGGSPVFAIAGTIPLEVGEKSSLPTLSLKISEDAATPSWGEVADHTYGQEVGFKSVATLPNNFASFANFGSVLTFKSEGFDLSGVTPTIVLDKNGSGTADEGDTTPTTSINKASEQLQITFTDLVAAGATKDSKILVDFNVPAGTVENRNVKAVFEYASNPVTTEKGKTPEQAVYDYSYKVKLTKQDNATSEKMEGVKFTVKNSTGKYIALSGNKVVEQDAEYKWTSGANGLIDIVGVDADTYTITETDTLTNYTKLAEAFTVALTANKATVSAVTASGAVSSGANASLVLAAETPTSGYAADVIVKNIKNIGLPVTGEQGIAIVVALGLILVIGGTIQTLRKRNRLNVEIEKLAE